MSESLTALDLAGMSPKELLDVETTSREQCIALIRENLQADDSDLDADAENIYEYFFNKSKEFLIYEFVHSLAEDPEYNFDALAAELE
jgi:hypothetical protein